jgi:hypothetical protein
VGSSNICIYIECMHYSGALRFGMSRLAHTFGKWQKKGDIAKVKQACSALSITARCTIDSTIEQ